MVAFVCFLFVVFYEEYKNMTYQSVLAMWWWRKEGQGVLMREFKFLTQNWFLGHKQPTAWVTRMTVRKSLSCLRTSTPGDLSRAPRTRLTWAWCRVWPRVTRSCYDSTFSSLPFYNQDWGWAKVISGFMISDNFPF